MSANVDLHCRSDANAKDIGRQSAPKHGLPVSTVRHGCGAAGRTWRLAAPKTENGSRRKKLHLGGSKMSDWVYTHLKLESKMEIPVKGGVHVNRIQFARVSFWRARASAVRSGIARGSGDRRRSSLHWSGSAFEHASQVRDGHSDPRQST